MPNLATTATRRKYCPSRPRWAGRGAQKHAQARHASAKHLNPLIVTHLGSLDRQTPDCFDVIVVGGGGSGLAAAVSAAQHGGSVLLLEKQPQLGGTTGIAVGSFTAASTRWQQARNIPDTPDNHADDAGKFASPEIEARNNSPLRAFFLGHAAETLDWLESLGVEFIGPSPEPPNRVPRMHNAVPNAKAYIAALQLELARRGGTILTNARVTDLLHEIWPRRRRSRFNRK